MPGCRCISIHLASAETELKLNPENITVQEGKDIDGTPVIAITVSTMPEAESASVSGQVQDFSFPSSFVATPAGEETAETSENLTDADLLDLQRLPAKITQISRDELEVSLQPLSAEDQAEQERERRHDLVYDSRDHDSDDEEEEQASTSTTNIPGAITGMVTRQIHKLFPGQVISPAELEGLVNKDQEDASRNQPAGPSSTGTSSDGTLDVSIDEIASTSGRDSDAPVDDLPSWETAVGQILQVVQLLKRVAPNPGPTPEDKQRRIDLMQKLDEVSQLQHLHNGCQLGMLERNWQLTISNMHL